MLFKVSSLLFAVLTLGLLASASPVNVEKRAAVSASTILAGLEASVDSIVSQIGKTTMCSIGWGSLTDSFRLQRALPQTHQPISPRFRRSSTSSSATSTRPPRRSEPSPVTGATTPKPPLLPSPPLLLSVAHFFCLAF